MNNYISIILSSVVLSSIITTVFSYYQNEHNNKTEHIAKHRTETDNSQLLRETIPKIYDAKNIKELKKQFSNIKRCLNPYYFIDKVPIDESNGMCKNNKQFTSDDIEHDVLIWDLIYKFENNINGSKNKKFEEYKVKLALYLSCSLKFDWDRYQQEINKLYKSNYKNELYTAVLSIFYTQDNCKCETQTKHQIMYIFNFDTVYLYASVMIVSLILNNFIKIDSIKNVLIVILAVLFLIRFIISVIVSCDNSKKIFISNIKSNIKYIIELMINSLIIVLVATFIINNANNIIGDNINKDYKNCNCINIKSPAEINISTVSIIE